MYQNLHFAKTLVQRDFTKNKNRSLSAEFRYLRNDTRLSLFGDWLLMSMLVKTVKEMGIHPNATRLRHMIRQSKEISGLEEFEKKKLLASL